MYTSHGTVKFSNDAMKVVLVVLESKRVSCHVQNSSTSHVQIQSYCKHSFYNYTVYISLQSLYLEHIFVDTYLK